jgi:transcriptional regulator GlxA family with amidase domain
MYQQIPDESTAASVAQLRSLVAELFMALNETLREERTNAEERLQRAACMLGTLQTREAQDGRPPGTTSPGGLAPWQVRRVLAYVEANLDKPIRNGDLADVARLSPFHFNVSFRKSVGDSPHEYIIRRRIERAQGLMLSTDASLSEIAITCGHADQAHFTRLFRRVVGESPGAWRRARCEPRE